MDDKKLLKCKICNTEKELKYFPKNVLLKSIKTCNACIGRYKISTIIGKMDSNESIEIKLRICLKCDKEFISVNELRICNKCKLTEEYKRGYL